MLRFLEVTKYFFVLATDNNDRVLRFSRMHLARRYSCRKTTERTLKRIAQTAVIKTRICSNFRSDKHDLRYYYRNIYALLWSRDGGKKKLHLSHQLLVLLFALQTAVT